MGLRSAVRAVVHEQAGYARNGEQDNTGGSRAEDAFGSPAFFPLTFALCVFLDWKIVSPMARMRGKKVEEPGCLTREMPVTGLGKVAAIVVIIHASDRPKTSM
jgi:hypothetical protein